MNKIKHDQWGRGYIHIRTRDGLYTTWLTKVIAQQFKYGETMESLANILNVPLLLIEDCIREELYKNKEDL